MTRCPIEMVFLKARFMGINFDINATSVANTKAVLTSKITCIQCITNVKRFDVVRAERLVNCINLSFVIRGALSIHYLYTVQTFNFCTSRLDVCQCHG